MSKYPELQLSLSQVQVAIYIYIWRNFRQSMQQVLTPLQKLSSTQKQSQYGCNSLLIELKTKTANGLTEPEKRLPKDGIYSKCLGSILLTSFFIKNNFQICSNLIRFMLKCVEIVQSTKKIYFFYFSLNFCMSAKKKTLYLIGTIRDILALDRNDFYYRCIRFLKSLAHLNFKPQI